MILKGLGIIHAIGKNITKYKVGQPSLVFEPRAYSEYMVSDLPLIDTYFK